MVVLGTRPEAIKLAPVIQALRARTATVLCQVCSTGQHADLAARALATFNLSADVDLGVMSDGNSLGTLTGALFNRLDPVLARFRPDWVVVQGDTTSAMAGALSGFYHQARVAHVEAGLRTGDLAAPFPEEANRLIVARVASLHCSPTESAAAQLRREGIDPARIEVTGNTIVDALRWAESALPADAPADLPAAIGPLDEDTRLVLVTTHRRESIGAGLENICSAVRRIAERNENVRVVVSVHMNPSVREPVQRLLAGCPRTALVEPMPYLPMVWLMRRAHHVLTDSGGIQEEAASLGTPVLVMREVTERQEVVDAGVGQVVGTSAQRISEASQALLDDPMLRQRMSRGGDYFGDGRSAQRIADLLTASTA